MSKKYEKQEAPICRKSGMCFARKDGTCSILQEVPFDVYRFQKPKRDYTHGHYYGKGDKK